MPARDTAPWLTAYEAPSDEQGVAARCLIGANDGCASWREQLGAAGSNYQYQQR